MGAVATVAFRVNPDVDAGTHEKISTGRAANKFGVSMGEAAALYARAAASPHLRPVGIAAHIGSQLTSLEPLAATFARMRALVGELRGAGLEVSRIDLGGGLGIPYDPAKPVPPNPDAYGALVRRAWEGIGARLAFEPGRLIVGNAGILVSRVVTVKRGDAGDFVIIDAAMNDLLRPTLYGAWHHIRAVRPRDGQAVATFAGPVCETGDEFARQRPTTPLEPGDLVAIMTAGAYGATMASEYNSRPLVAELLVRGGRFAVVRPRRTLEAMLADERRAPWLEETT
jgi:diaminopimelate decarboxylase